MHASRGLLFEQDDNGTTHSDAMRAAEESGQKCCGI